MEPFASTPGLIFVVATLLPLASFALILLAFALRTAVRSSPEGSLGRSLYDATGGDTPARWPAWVATGAIALAFVCSATGFVWYLSDYHHAEHVKQDAEKKRAEHRELGKAPPNETEEEANRRKATRREVVREIEALNRQLDEHDERWNGSVTWLKLGGDADTRQGTALLLGFKIDHLSAIMFVMVTLVASLIHLFSIGYMGEETQPTVEDHQAHVARRGRFGRFFLFMSLFCFSMLNLVLANNLFQVFVSWELVGICSYLLIGFYFERQSASNAANKAFITNRVGDAGFIVGMLILWTYLGTFSFDELFGRVRSPGLDTHGDAMPMAGQVVRGEATATAAGGKTFTMSPADGPDVLLFPANIDMPFTGYRDERAKEEGRKPPKGAHLHGHDLAPTTADENDPDKQVPTTVTDIKTDPAEDDFASMPYWLLVVAGLGIFLGCVGKSAQFPLQVWLPDAMEGPTPVSALIHAATMVAAGVYLVGRCFPLFTAEVLLVIAYVGAITLFVAATIAVVMTDIKKVLAYSTVSQLGYMMLALGIGGWVAGLFHLLTHAFFKALLFLCSGAVIYNCHHEQEMTKMGGLYPKMKITALTMLIGVLAIAGIPGFSGWFSKDAIVAQGAGFAYVHPHHALLFLLPLLTAGLTTFYMFRMWFLTFTGKPRDHHVYEHAHEAPRTMTVPLIVLAVFSVCVAWGWPFFSSHPPFINAESSWLEHQIHHAQPAAVQAEFGTTGVRGGEVWLAPNAKPVEENVRLQALEFHEMAGNLALLMVLIGFSFAWLMYYRRVLDPAEGEAQFPGVARFLQHKWYFDELYSVALVRPALAVAHWCRNIDLKGIDWLLDNSAYATVRVAKGGGRFDNGVIDGLVNLTADVAQGVGAWFRRWQTGYLRSYVLFLVMAAVGIYIVLSFFMTAAG